jgi:SWI/SNF-related matrix-associated actin-dependent regulator 1 of chromatin subfamily A
LKKYITKLSKPVDMTLNIEESLYDTLLPFQVEGVNFIIKRHGRGLIGDEMGVGKTVQAIALLQHYRKHWPALILVPSSLMQQWNDELLLYSGDILQQKDICQVKKGSDKVGGKVCLVPYNLMDKLSNKESLSHSQFGIVIADESHNLKNKDAQRTAVCLPYLKNAVVAICLTGTPALNRPVELYTQLNGILPEVFNDYDAFTKRYCDAKPSNFGKNAIDVKGSSNEAELKLLLEGAVMIRRLKDVVLKDRLPSKQREVRYCNIDPLYENEKWSTVSN